MGAVVPRLTAHPAGLPLALLAPVFRPVPSDATAHPSSTVDYYALLAPFASDILACCDAERARMHGRTVGTESATLMADFRTRFRVRHEAMLVPAATWEHVPLDARAKLWCDARVALPGISAAFEGGSLAHPTPIMDANGASARVLGRILSAQARWGNLTRDWNTAVAVYEGLRAFEFGLADSEVFLDYAPGWLERGYGTHTGVSLDGALAFMVHRKGRHVLTLAISPSDGRRLLVHQVHLAQAKGNRWLYQLPAPLMEHVLARLAAAFPHFELALVSGIDLAHAILSAYDPRGPVPSAGTLRRIMRTYDAPLSGWSRAPAILRGPLGPSGRTSGPTQLRFAPLRRP